MNALRTLQAAIRGAHTICAILVFSNLLQAAGPVKLVVQDGRPVVDGVYVNGHGPYRFLVDTGANVNLIETNLAKAVGIEETLKDQLASATGATAVSGASDLEVQLDSVKADRQMFIFSDLEAIHHLSSDIHGVLGQSFLSRFDYLLDLRNKSLEFGKREASGARVSFEWVNGRPVIATNVGNMVLDTGTKWVFVFGAEGVTASQSVRTLSGSTTAGTLTRKIAVEGHVIWNGEAVAMPRQPQETGDGLLPANIFKAIYVCNTERYVVFN
jgi:hypothetical protein